MKRSLYRARCIATVMAVAIAVLWGLPAAAADPIVGTWVGQGSHEGREDQFNMRLTFVSPKGGVSRYSDVPCGGVLVGDRKGNGYEYQETITFNGLEERSDNYCVSGLVRLSVEGDTMKYDWSPNRAGEELSASGTLKRVEAR